MTNGIEYRLAWRDIIDESIYDVNTKVVEQIATWDFFMVLSSTGPRQLHIKNPKESHDRNIKKCCHSNLIRVNVVPMSLARLKFTIDTNFVLFSLLI